uniref:Uncharacterized protein n=1 Tax=Leersia perrieri TaxID=77586 RepID=A0A0D9UXZ4_9ORYZ
MPSSSLLARAARQARRVASSAAPITAQELGQAAYVVARAAADWGVVSNALARAALALPASEPDGRHRAAVDLVFAAAMLAREAQNSGMLVLSEIIGDLQRAGHNYVSSMEFEARRRCPGRAGADGFVGCCAGATMRMHLSVILKLPFCVHIVFSVAILPYLKGMGGLKNLKSSDFPISSHTFVLIFCTWWLCVALGVVCSSRGRSTCKNIVALILDMFSQVVGRCALLGVTLLGIFFTHLELAPDDINSLKAFVWIAVFAHVLVSVLDFWSRCQGGRSGGAALGLAREVVEVAMSAVVTPKLEHCWWFIAAALLSPVGDC